jgi:hypothetical protein
MTEVQPVVSASNIKIVDETAHTVSPEQAGPSTSSGVIPDTREVVQEGTQQQRPQTPVPVLENPEWGLKEIIWPPEPWEGEPQYRVRIVTQNANGPCSFIAICKSYTSLHEVVWFFM